MPAMGDKVQESLNNVVEAASRYRALELLILFGSRARGDAHATSDWDFGYLAGPDLDVDLLLAELVIATRSDYVDLVNLARSGGLLRIHAARDGIVLVENSADAFERFSFEAASFWCDVEPVLRKAYDGLLAEIQL